jgi:hypothetical protein
MGILTGFSDVLRNVRSNAVRSGHGRKGVKGENEPLTVFTVNHLSHLRHKQTHVTHLSLASSLPQPQEVQPSSMLFSCVKRPAPAASKLHNSE